MTDPDQNPADDPLAALLGATAHDAAPVDRAALDALRERSLAAFAATAPATPASPSPPKERPMFFLRWSAATAAALLVAGLVAAYWLANRPPDVPPQPDDKFVVEGKLADDGRIGRVTDAQGAVAVKPVQAERWSPVQPRLVLKPGDWLRTDARGANAVAVRLAAARVIVGPHSMVELVKAGEVRLLEGEAEVTASDAAPVELVGPDGEKVVVKGRQHFEVRKDKLARVEQEPRWLQGFKGATANESVGSLVAKVDGRDVPLTVGYHHVTVDIRDQIARTTIEESFVNTTPNTLEGVFHFPLPSDASISGFGMWIGDQLVEADVVEKQRAREIYEEILREKRDPALLEWAGGNIFKARVFPIPGRAEKRIKITYTQVLPLQGNRYRYSYALQSELLKQHPLRELKIDVTVSSAVGLKGASSPTHPARVTKTERSGRVEFAAQEHTPARDFEAVFEMEPGRPDVVVVPHRRGGDGYFMVQLTPPGSASDWERPLVPNGTSLRLLVVADTSASMDKAQRASQNAVLGALLGALTPKDTVNVAACDVNCDWAFEKPVPATAAHVATARKFVEERASLGWTDLDKAFASALARAEPGTHVVYLGDATPTTGNADPAAFADRLKRLYAGMSGTFHAVALGSTYEPLALKAIGSLGGGSVRRVSADRTPQATALDLLTEIASPSLRDVKVEFTGVRVARVYPEVLPNVPAGTQQILLGRYLPEGKDQSGEVVVTGTLAGKVVRYTSKLTLKDAEQGNSFVPRLWARMHLDRLLEQGRTEAVKQDVIALSEEFHIITPYTSLLVLETDADRARFAVRRRFNMRDGEEFFAKGRDDATFELKRKQMRLAAAYRTALRRNVLSQLHALGRDASLFRTRSRDFDTLRLAESENGQLIFGGSVNSDAGLSGVIELQRHEWALGDLKLRPPAAQPFLDAPAEAKPDGAEPLGATGRDLPALGTRGEFDGAVDDRRDTRDLAMYNFQTLGGEYGFGERITTDSLGGEGYGLGFDLRAGLPESLQEPGRPRGRLSSRGLGSNIFYRESVYQRDRGPQLQWFGTLFPALAPPARDPKEPKTPWPAPALALSRSLLRADTLAQLKGGVAITRQSDTFNTRGELAARTARVELASAGAWLARTAPDRGAAAVSWCDPKELGTYNAAFQLGRVRAADKGDLSRPPFELADHSLAPLHIDYAHMTPKVEAVAKDRALLILTHRDRSEFRVLIDTERRVVLSAETRSNKGKVLGQMRFGDFAEVAGQWWARKVETLDGDGRRTALATQTVAELPADEFAKRMTQELSGKDKVLFLPHPLPTVAEAKRRVAEQKATPADRAVLTLYFAATQQWARSLEHFGEFEKLSAGKPGVRWLRDSFLLASRRHEELRTRLLAAAKQLAGADADARANGYFLAEHVSNSGGQVLQADEQLALNDSLRPVYEAQPAHVEGAKAWRSRRVALLEQAGQADKALALAKELATAYPRDYYIQYRYAQSLAGVDDYAAAYAWLDLVLAPPAGWESAEEQTLRDQYAGFLRQQGRYREMTEFLGAWAGRNPESESAYAQLLTALVRSNQAARAEELVAQWLREAQVEGELPAATAARLRAAVEFALGRGYNLSTNRIGERWFAPLAAVARFFSRRDDYAGSIANIFNDARFASSDVGRALRKELTELLTTEIATLPLARVEYLMSWVWAHDGSEKDAWRAIAAALRKRWDAEADADVKHRLGEQLARVLAWLDEGEWLAFLRARLAGAPGAYRTHYAHRLFEVLVARPWTPEVEDELFALLPKLAGPDEPADGLAARVAGLYRLTELMVERRYEARMKGVERPDQLTRTELQKKEAENRKAAREGFADRLRKEAARHPGAFAQWLSAERVWLDVTLDRDPKGAADDSWAILTEPAVKATAEDEGGAVAARLDEILRARALAVLQNLAARKGADAALVDRLVKFLDEQTAAHPDAPRWRGEKYKLLIALDRPKELEAELVRWTTGPGADTRWRVALGHLFAEQGKVGDAIAQFERVEAADELTPPTYRALAEWYLVEGRRAEHDRVTVAAYKTADERELSSRLGGYLSPWRRTSGPLPTAFDPEVLNVFRSLFEKSAAPQSYLGPLGQFYGASRDFRLLSMLPDAVVGHTAGKVYPFLAGMRGVLAEVRDEATADGIVKRVGEVRATAKTSVDRRALDLLELLVERRAAELQNQPGPHAAKALAALERAAKPEWAPGEPRLMADFLTGLGTAPQEALAKEQLRKLEALHRAAAAGTFDRLDIGHRYAQVLDAHSRRADATDLLETALKEFEGANGGALPASANSAVETLVWVLEAAGHYDRAERFLLDRLARPIHAWQRRWLTRFLNDQYHRALTHKARVSLGEGAALYKALEGRLLAELADPDQNIRFDAVVRLTRVYSTADDLKFAGVADDVKAFAFDRVPKLLAEQTVSYESIVRDVADAVAARRGPRDAIAFLLDRADTEPDWRRYASEDVWAQNSDRVAERRVDAKELGDLEPRLLALALKELRRQLLARQSSRGSLWNQYGAFWAAKADAFAAVAEAVLKEEGESGPAAEHVAAFLFSELGREARAVEILLAAHAAKRLGESGQATLVRCLFSLSRFAESVPILAVLVAERPEEIEYRTRLMHAYFRTGKQAELLALLKATDAHFHDKDRWTERALAALADSCLENRLFAQAAAYYEELIPRHQRAAGERISDDVTLSGYYGNAARAYAGLGKTKEAVDMASGAVVTWGPHAEPRKAALAALVEVLTRAGDLEGYVKWLDKEPLQSAVVRKALGKAYVAKNDHARARTQLQQAAELQPGDAETYELLLACCDKTGDPLAAVDALLAAVEVSRRDLKLFEQLGRRYAELDRPAEAERAYTSVVEMLPNESEGHAALAEVREKQGRWGDAAAHWERVAEVRALEPTGLLKLAAAQIEGKAYGPAAETLRKLRARAWPPRFADVEKQTRELERKLEGRSKK